MQVAEVEKIEPTINHAMTHETTPIDASEPRSQGNTGSTNPLDPNYSNPPVSSTQRIGPYVLGKTLGVGTTGRVKLGTHRETRQKVAIKILSKAFLQSGDIPSKKIEREIAIMKLLQHPNILSLYDVYETNDELYHTITSLLNFRFMVLENVEGGELFDYLVKKGKLSESEAVKFFGQIISGIDYCHQHLICHRDLKPENLLLSINHDIKIADFGMASLQRNGRLLETSCGSPHYASPEIIRGDKYDGAPADIWSCGVILYALLTGTLPFDDENIRRLLMKVKLGRYPMPKDLSPEATDLISRMLQVDINKRIKMPDIMNHEIFKKYDIQLKSETPIFKNQILKKLDADILKSLELLGWNNLMELQASLQSSEENLEKVFYYLLMKRKTDYLESHDFGSTDVLANPEKLMHANKSSNDLLSNARLSTNMKNYSLNELPQMEDFAKDGSMNLSQRLLKIATSKDEMQSEPRSSNPIIKVSTADLQGEAAESPRFHRRKITDSSLLPSPIYSAVPKKSWFANLFNFKADSRSFTCKNSSITAITASHSIKESLTALNITFYEKNMKSLRCSFLLTGSQKNIKFKIDFQESEKSPCKIVFTHQNGPVQEFRDLVNMITHKLLDDIIEEIN